jgi:energy-coupling factor transport system ATP-binding protein
MEGCIGRWRLQFDQWGNLYYDLPVHGCFSCKSILDSCLARRPSNHIGEHNYRRYSVYTGKGTLSEKRLGTATVNELVRFENLSFTYPRGLRKALMEIDLSFEKGSVVGITGPAGAGKSTLLSCINGVIPHYIKGELTGRVSIKDREVASLSFSQLAPIVGTVFQDVDFQTVSITVEEEVAFGPENLGVQPEIIRDRIANALQSTGVIALRNRAINTLSGGQKQRVAIAAVLSMLPEILLLDEPTSELDPIGTQEVFDAIFQLNKHYGMTIIIVSQKVERLVGCHRLLVISQGKIMLDGTPKDVFAHHRILSDIGVAVPEVIAFVSSLFEKIGRPFSVESLPMTVDEAEKILKDILQNCGAAP